MNLWIMRSRFVTIIATLMAVISLSACSSKPDVKDISRQLAFNCDLWDIKEFKKFDGADIGNNQYEMTYTFTAEFAGGKRAAAEFLSKRMDLAAKKHQAIYAAARGGQAEELELQKIDQQVFQMQSSCQDLEALSWLEYLGHLVKENLDSGRNEIPIPYALELSGRGILTKAESGWVLQNADPHRILKVIQSDPVKFEQQDAQATKTISSTNPPTSATVPQSDLSPNKALAENAEPIAPPIQAQGSGLDCAKATSPSEKTNCGDAKAVEPNVAVNNSGKGLPTGNANLDATAPKASVRVEKLLFKSVDRKTTAGQLANGKFQLADTISGELIFPDSGDGPFPVMVIAHGSGGVSKREYAWAEFFKSKGAASFIVDTYKERGIHDTETDLPQLTFPASTADHLLALKLLATHPKVDSKRIGIIGFSRGGQISVGSAFDDWRKNLVGNLKFAVHLPFYGGCNWIAEHWDGSPIHTFIGDSDDYAQPVATCEAQRRFLDKAGVKHSLNVFSGARHGFDNLGRDKDLYLPQAQGGSKCSYIWNVDSQVYYSPAQSNQAKPAAGLGDEIKKCMVRGATVGPSLKATEEAKNKVAQILAETILKR